jgi:hypothetical protein
MAMSAIIRKTFGHRKSIGNSLLGTWKLEVGSWVRLYAAPMAGARCYGRPRLRVRRQREVVLMTRGRRVLVFRSVGWVRVCWSRVGLMQAKGAR